MTLVSEAEGQLWRSSLLPSFLRLQTEGLTTNTLLVVVGEQGACQEPLLAHSLVLAAASPALASILATSRDSEITLILAGVEWEEMEGVLEDIYMGRDRARVFLQQCGLWEEDLESESISSDCKDIGETTFQVTDDLGQKQKPEAISSLTQELISKEEPLENLNEIKDDLILKQALSKLNYSNICGHCDKIIKNNRFRSHIEKHMKSKLTWHHMDKQRGIKHMCDECGRCFTHNFTLAAHIRDRHSGKVNKCDKCEFTCIGPKDQLVLHKKMRHGLCNFICPMCDFKSSSDEELEQHKNRHHCSQEVVISSKMKHEKIRKEREALIDYSCKICKIAYKSRQMLAYHINAAHK